MRSFSQRAEAEYALDTTFRYTQRDKSSCVYSSKTMEEEKQHNQGIKQVQQPGDKFPLKKGTGSSAIRAELNIEKWPAIWKPAMSKHPPAVRRLKRELTLQSGARFTARVELGYTNLGELTTEDQKIYYALVKQWELNGRGTAQTFFSIRGLAKILKKRWGTNVIDAITGSLRRLRTAPFTWENSYVDGGRKSTIEEIDTFTILSDLKLIRQKTDGRVTKEAGYFQFNDLTLRNLLSHHTKPVLFEIILQFRSEIAQLIYTHADLILSDKRQYARRSKELFDDLGLRGSEYGRINRRKITLERALRELQGVPISTGVISRAGLERTQDGKDYKVVFIKSSGRVERAKAEVPSRGEVALLSDSRTEAERQAEEIVSQFHKIFHNVFPAFPPSKEVAQAASLIAQHGIDRARYVVEFSFKAAAQTKYAPQTFGGILQYTSRAIAAYEENLRKTESATRNNAEALNRGNWEELQKKVEEAQRAGAQAKIESMPERERNAFYERVKQDLVRHSPWLSQSTSTRIIDGIVRGGMLAEIMASRCADDCRAQH